MRKKLPLAFIMFVFILISMVQMSASASVLPSSTPKYGTPGYDAWKQSLLRPQNGQNVRSLLSAQSVINNTMSNEFIAFAVSNSGNFTVGTTGGDPLSSSDDNKNLLYGHPYPRTSYTTVNIDGTPYVFSAGSAPVFDESLGKCTSSETIGDLTITQELTIIKSDVTQRDDTVQIKYNIVNNGETSHNAGLRIMMDTQLGYNDAAEFRIPSIGAVTHELELSGSDIPEYWQAFDDIENPTVISQGTFFRNSVNKPDKVQFTNWSRVYRTSWDYVTNPDYENGDSAVSVIWEPKQLAPGETKEYVTYYGLGALSQDLTTSLGVSLTGVSSIEAGSIGYNLNPFTVTAYISNTGTQTETNVKAKINLPEGCHLANGYREIDIGSIEPSGTKQVSWQIFVDPIGTIRNTSYSVDVDGDNLNTINVSKNLTIAAADVTGPVITVTPTGTNGTNDWFTSDVDVNISAVDNQSGVSQILYSLDGSQPTLPYTGHFNLSSEGLHTINVSSTDNWGNTTTTSTIVKIDKINPVISTNEIPQDIAVGSNIFLGINPTDNMSGISSIVTSLNGTVVNNTSSLTIVNPGVNIISITALDGAGNSTTKEFRVNAYVNSKISSSIINLKGSPNHKLALLTIKLPDGYTFTNTTSSTTLLNNIYTPIPNPTIRSVYIPQLAPAAANALVAYLYSGINMTDSVLLDVDNDGKLELIVMFDILDITQLTTTQTFTVNVEGNYGTGTFKGSTTATIKK